MFLLAEGRQLPVALVSPAQMLAVSSKPLMRLLLENQAKINQVYQRYLVRARNARQSFNFVRWTRTARCVLVSILRCIVPCDSPPHDVPFLSV